MRSNEQTSNETRIVLRHSGENLFDLASRMRSISDELGCTAVSHIMPPIDAQLIAKPNQPPILRSSRQ